MNDTRERVRGAEAGEPMQREMTLTEFIVGEQRRAPQATGHFSTLLNDVCLACKRIAYLVSKGRLAGTHGLAGTQNLHGEQQTRLDVVSNDIFLRTNEWGGHLAGMASEELEHPYAIPAEYPRGRYLLLFDPLDGSSNADVNVAVGSIFSVLRAAEGSGGATRDAGGLAESDFLQRGCAQVCAGYAIYGPTTMLVLTLGRGAHGFTLDRDIGEFRLTHSDMRIPENTSEFAINASNERFWEPPVKRYVSECLAGRSGPLGRDFNMRWIASMVAEVHHILVRGGLFMYPRDTKDPAEPGRLRLLYGANPMAMIVEQAGGAATTGRERILDILPSALHQRVPVILGSTNAVALIEHYHRQYEQGLDQPYTSPLFRPRSLYSQN